MRCIVLRPQWRSWLECVMGTTATERRILHTTQDMMQPLPKLKLVLVRPRFVTGPVDEYHVPEHQSMSVSRRLFDMSVSLAVRDGLKLTGRKLHTRHLTAGQVVDFARHIRAAVAAFTAPKVPLARRSIPDLVDSYFEQPARLKSLNRLVDFLEGGGELTATEV